MKKTLSISVFIFLIVQVSIPAQNIILLKPSSLGNSTVLIQNAIDSLGKIGGGIVQLTTGHYLSGGLELKSNVRLHLEKGTTLMGSEKYADYNAEKDAFIYGENLSNIAITGEGTIDGTDCYNPHGEEGFRGPHCIRLINCKKIIIKDVTITRSANWAINCRYCKGGRVENVKIRGGHDGLHTRFCRNFTVNGCDFRTGDDCFAGNDNRNFIITNCLVNTSCSGFRFGCLNLKIEHCKIWGPGEYMHRIWKERRMPTAFVHFSPDDENGRLPSANWIVRDLEVDSVEHFYVYNHRDGLWQTGQPAYSISFENVRAKNILNAFYMVDKNDDFTLSIKNSSFSFPEGGEYKPASFEDVPFHGVNFFYAEHFKYLKLNNVNFEKKGEKCLLLCTLGKKVRFKSTCFITRSEGKPYQLEKIKKIRLSGCSNL